MENAFRWAPTSRRQTGTTQLSRCIHSPPIANVVHVAPIAVSPAAPAPATLVALRSRTLFTAALPRGPPSFLA